MKLNHLAFPHPILGRADDITGKSEITDLDIEIQSEQYKVSFSIKHDNGTISDLIRIGKAKYFCEILCGNTMLREIISSSKNNFEITINRVDVRNKVEFSVFCAATTDLSGYNNPAAHEDYSGFIFNLEKADLLAYFGQFEFNAAIQYHKLKAASSFMEIIPHQGNQIFTEYVLDTQKIQIKLAKETYEKFKLDSIGKKKEFAPIIHASLVQTALTYALFNYNKYLEMENCLWAASISQRLKDELDLNNGSDQIDPDHIPLLVQKLLGNPNERLVDCLEKLTIANDLD